MKMIKVESCYQCYHQLNDGFCPKLSRFTYNNFLLPTDCPLEDIPEQTEITDEQFAKELNKRWANIDWSAIKYDRTKMIIWLREQLLKPQGGEK